MASNFPTSLDNFTNPVSGNTLDSPSHSLQHSDINDAVEAMQRKVGVGTAVAGSASAGQVLTISAAGTSTWSTPSAGGLVQIVPTSVAVGSGSGSVDANGKVTFSGASSLSINSIFSATYQNYEILLALSGVSNDTNISLRLRTSGTDASGSNYNVGALELMTTATGPNLYRRANDVSAFFMNVDSGQNSDYYSTRFDFFNPFNAKRTTGVFQSMASTQAGTFASYVGGINHTLETSYDSITFFPEAGTFSGTISIYGYR